MKKFLLGFITACALLIGLVLYNTESQTYTITSMVKENAYGKASDGTGVYFTDNTNSLQKGNHVRVFYKRGTQGESILFIWKM